MVAHPTQYRRDRLLLSLRIRVRDWRVSARRLSLSVLPCACVQIACPASATATSPGSIVAPKRGQSRQLVSPNLRHRRFPRFITHMNYHQAWDPTPRPRSDGGIFQTSRCTWLSTLVGYPVAVHVIPQMPADSPSGLFVWLVQVSARHLAVLSKSSRSIVSAAREVDLEDVDSFIGLEPLFPVQYVEDGSLSVESLTQCFLTEHPPTVCSWITSESTVSR
jgi:hypothetical protein